MYVLINQPFKLINNIYSGCQQVIFDDYEIRKLILKYQNLILSV